MWLDICIIVDSVMIHQITRLSIQGPDLQEFYPGKVVYYALVQKIKYRYDDVDKGKRGYKVASIHNGLVRLACQLIAGKLVWKNKPT
jgi:hypothetical protein